MLCKRCGKSVEELAVIAMLVDLRARVFPSPSECLDGKEHEFVKEEQSESAKQSG